jgi:immunoglobulin-like protein involved in spore germination/sporulation and spore germination protein
MTNERQDDEIIGRALSRAIETIDVNQTPFERSRIATAPARRSIFGLWQIATAAAAIVLALAIGSWLTRPTESQPGVAASPSATATAPDTTPSPAATPSSPATFVTVYYARDGLPPVGVKVQMGQIPTTAERVGFHIGATLQQYGPIPPGAFSAFPGRRGGDVYNPVSELGEVKVNGDLATVDFKVDGGDWQVRGSAATTALLQQIVYNATEEPGIRRVLITQNGGQRATIDQLVVTTPLSREDVFGYSVAAKPGASGAIADGGDTAASYQVALTSSVDTLAPGLARVVLTFKSPNGADVADRPGFTASLDQSDSATSPSDAKYLLNVQLQAARITWMTADTVIDRTPLRFVRVSGSTLGIGLDDARPWRLFTLSNPARIVVDVGGPTRSVSDRIAVYRAEPSAATPVCSNTCDVQVSGAARVFEANVVWRVKDTAGKVIAKGQFLASLGSSPVWGTFDTSLQVPSTFRGNATLEVYEASAKDGSEQGLVQIPLVIR